MLAIIISMHLLMGPPTVIPSLPSMWTQASCSKSVAVVQKPGLGQGWEEGPQPPKPHPCSPVSAPTPDSLSLLPQGLWRDWDATLSPHHHLLKSLPVTHSSLSQAMQVPWPWSLWA